MALRAQRFSLGVLTLTCYRTVRPANVTLAQDLTIVDNFIRLGGVWGRSGSAEVLIDDNNIANGAGPGIRLSNAGETDATTKEFFYAALKRAPAAETKAARAIFSKASYSRAGGLRAIAAECLSAVQITDNVIQHMDGSGITTFVDQVSGTDLIAHGDIEDLVIEGNEIIECVQNLPDAVLTDAVVAGSVLLSAITRMRIAANTITRNG